MANTPEIARLAIAQSKYPPLDLSGSYGKAGNLTCPEMVDALARFRHSCNVHGKSAGMHLVHPDTDNIRSAIDDGYSMITLGLDNVFLAAGAHSAIDHSRIAAAEGKLVTLV